MRDCFQVCVHGCWHYPRSVACWCSPTPRISIDTSGLKYQCYHIRPNEIGSNGKYMEHITTSPPEKNLKLFEFLLRNMTSSVLCISHLPSVALKHVYDWAAMEREVIVARAVLSCPMVLHYPSIPVKGGDPSRSPLLLTTLLVYEHWFKLEAQIRKSGISNLHRTVLPVNTP